VLGTLVWGMKNLREAGGDFRMFGIHDFVQRLFTITQLDRAFRVFEEEDEAVASYA
jgi:anti-anti-sigma regulatory factor